MSLLRTTMFLSLLCLPLCTGCLGIGGSSAPPAPGLGVAEKDFNARWDVDPTSAACVKENLATTCHYLYHGAHVTVTYNAQKQADQIIVDGLPHSRLNMWTFLTGMVPSGSSVISCKDIAHSNGGGKAHVCLYRGKRNVVVARYLHPNDPSYGGFVGYDYAGYADVKIQDQR